MALMGGAGEVFWNFKGQESDDDDNDDGDDGHDDEGLGDDGGEEREMLESELVRLCSDLGLRLGGVWGEETDPEVCGEDACFWLVRKNGGSASEGDKNDRDDGEKRDVPYGSTSDGGTHSPPSDSSSSGSSEGGDAVAPAPKPDMPEIQERVRIQGSPLSPVAEGVLYTTARKDGGGSGDEGAGMSECGMFETEGYYHPRADLGLGLGLGPGGGRPRSYNDDDDVIGDSRGTDKGRRDVPAHDGNAHGAVDAKEDPQNASVPMPMLCNLGRDLGDFLKWEAEHVYASGYSGH